MCLIAMSNQYALNHLIGIIWIYNGNAYDSMLDL